MKLIQYLNRFFSVSLTPEEIIYLTAVQIRAM